MPKKPKVGLFTSAWGHVSIAQAIEQALEDVVQVELLQEQDPLFKLYNLMYQFFPAGNKLSYKVTSTKQSLKTLHRYFKLKYSGQIEEFYVTHRPEILISTYFMFNPPASKLSRIANIKYINIVPDPKTIHPIMVDSSADMNFTFDKTAVERIKEISPDARVKAVGWFVRQEYEQEYDQQQVRRELNLKEMQTLLIVAGSEGSNTVLKILPTFIESPQPIQVIVACGDNQLLYKSTQSLAKIAEKIGTNTIIPLQFTSQLHKYMQAADLIVGKAGPNTLFEAVATLTPFFAITHIAGQEDGNLEIIEDKKLGFVEENPIKAISLLRKLIKDPTLYQKYHPSLKKMAEFNKKSKETLKQYVLKNLPKK